MAAAVLQPLSSLSINHEIMAPSPISPNASRHGRGRHGGSVAKGKTRGRGYSIVDERDVMISKALTWVLKRTIDEGDEQGEGEERLVADSEGWVDLEDVVSKPHLSALQVSFAELQSLIASPSSKSRFVLKLKPDSTDEELDASDYLIRLTPTQTPSSPTTSSAPKLTPLTLESPDLPEIIIYQTSYANYPLILDYGALKRAGGQAHLQFTALPTTDSEIKAPDADVSIYLPLRALLSNPAFSFVRNENGAILTEGNSKGEVGKKYWSKVVARRADIGVLYEDGEVRKEVPVGLRGKGVKAKKGGKGKGKGGLKKMKDGSSEDGSASD